MYYIYIINNHFISFFKPESGNSKSLKKYQLSQNYEYRKFISAQCLNYKLEIKKTTSKWTRRPVIGKRSFVYHSAKYILYFYFMVMLDNRDDLYLLHGFIKENRPRLSCNATKDFLEIYHLIFKDSLNFCVPRFSKCQFQRNGFHLHVL